MKDMVSRIASRIVESMRGMQTRRKDKDLMSDTGGTSKGRDRDPWLKPPREDLENHGSTKRKNPSEMDKDTDLDPDLK